ncbi:NADPH oxidase activator 1-like [Nematolebias whitei]|uniref:NADPH oxidase activator 1-like n=1 Tax=Nematolebias whitei TaxID=451745 RepID=UPI00189A2E24|nr:NADPH oxidase activator 1-like [Nematolebias whitei]
MLYTELLQLWNESVQLLDAKDWLGALAKLQLITEPTSRLHFNAASAHLALGQLDLAQRSLDFTIAKDERLAVAFFQRAAVMMQLGRLEEALSNCIWAQKHMRGNAVIDYKQLGLRFKLFSWQVLHNAAAVYCQMGHWDQARDVLLTSSQERGAGRMANIEVALDSIEVTGGGGREEECGLTRWRTASDTSFDFFDLSSMALKLAPNSAFAVMGPSNKSFCSFSGREGKLQQKIHTLHLVEGAHSPQVISSLIPNDDFGGFESLREQKPGFYEPQMDGALDKETHYMRVRRPFMAQGPGQLTVPGGAMVFLFGDEDRDGMINVIYDGQRGLLPMAFLELANAKAPKGKNDNRVPSGIPLPPELKPPTRPQARPKPAAPPRETPPPSYTPETHLPPSASEPPKCTANAADQQAGSSEGAGAASVVVKVHYTYSVALSVPLDTPNHKLKGQIAQKLGHPASQLHLRHKQHGSRVLTPLNEEVEPGCTIQEVAEDGRVTLWCQREDPLANRTILYEMVALYDYTAQGPEDLEFSEGDTIDILGEVNEEWLEGHCGGKLGIFPSCFAYRENENFMQNSDS